MRRGFLAAVPWLLPFIGACASAPSWEYEPNPPLPSLQSTTVSVLVVELQDWRPPSTGDGEPRGGIESIPGVLFGSRGTVQRRAEVGRCLYTELRASRGFAEVRYAEAWPESVAPDEIIVNGRLLEDGVSGRRWSYGLSILSLIPWFAGAPIMTYEHSYAFEVSAARAAEPETLLLQRRVTLPNESASAGMYTSWTGSEPAAEITTDGRFRFFPPCPTDELRPYFAAITQDLIAIARDGQR